MASELWVATLRKQVRQVLGKGWKVGPARNGNAFLQRVELAPRGEKSPSKTIQLPYEWRENESGDIYLRCRTIHQLMVRDQLPFLEAAKVADGASSKSVEDWAGAIQQFEQYKRNHGTQIGDRTWGKQYLPHLERITELVKTRGGPSTGTEVLEAIAIQWKPGTVSRRHAVRSSAAFLNYAVDRLHFKAGWAAPRNLNPIIGKAKGTAKRVGYPLLDDECLRLVDAIDAPSWKFAVQLSIAYGLRPEDLRHLTIRSGALWSDYEKAGGGGHTKPRKLALLAAAGEDWDLQARFAAGEALPPLGAPGHAGDALGTFLKRLPVWQELRAEVAAKGHELVPYSMRHSYVRRGQLRSIPPKVLAGALGHSLASHLAAYSGWELDSEADAFFD